MPVHIDVESFDASPITSCAMAGLNSCNDIPLPGSSVVSSRNSSGIPASPKHSVCLEAYPSSPSVYSLTSAHTSDWESPPETPARSRSTLNLARAADPIPESDFNDEFDMAGLFALNHQHNSGDLDDSEPSRVVIFSLRRWRKRLTEAKLTRSSGVEPLAPRNIPLQTNLLGNVNPLSGSVPHRTRGRNSQGLGGVPPMVSHSPTINSSTRATPTRDTVGCSPDDPINLLRRSKRTHCPAPLDIKSISSYNVFMYQDRGYDTNETKYKKGVTTALGLGLPSTIGGHKAIRMQGDNSAHLLDLVGSLRYISPSRFPRWRSSSQPPPMVSPAPASAPLALRFPPAPRLRPVDPVDLLDHVPSPLELPSPPICDVNNSNARSAPADQMYFDRISRSSPAGIGRPLSAKAPTRTAMASHPSSQPRLVLPPVPAYRRTPSFLKEAIASLTGSALQSPIPPRLVGTPYLESGSSPFSPHFQPHRDRRFAPEVLRRNASVDLDKVDEHWIDVTVPPSRILPQLSRSSSLTARQSSPPKGRAGQGPSARRKKPPTKGAMTACNPYFADAEYTRLKGA